MLSDEIKALIAKQFSFALTPGQQRAALLLSHFICTPKADAACILRGYAGTGKTSLVGALVKVMRMLKREVVLLAPTGRAAKVFSHHAGEAAYTIHRIIYRQQTFQGENTRFSLGYNKLRHALFIVDEASMLSSGTGSMGQSLFGTGELLDDLIRYVYSGEGCRLLMVGDTAQLPPVGEVDSPALSDDVLRGYGLLVGSADLTEVVRQKSQSDVLSGATLLRTLLAEEFNGIPPIHTDRHGEVRALPGTELIESLVSDYQEFGSDEVIVVTRSNKRANIYNEGIRSRIFDREDELTRGDLIMVVKNNYFWTAQLAKTLQKDETLPLILLPTATRRKWFGCAMYTSNMDFVLPMPHYVSPIMPTSKWTVVYCSPRSRVNRHRLHARKTNNSTNEFCLTTSTSPPSATDSKHCVKILTTTHCK